MLEILKEDESVRKTLGFTDPIDTPEKHVAFLEALFNQPQVSKFLLTMLFEGTLETYLPWQLRAGVGMKQPPEHHEHEVFDHCCFCAEWVQGPWWLRMTGLFHDLGKVATRTVDPITGKIGYPSHDKVGAEMAKIWMGPLWKALQARGVNPDLIVAIIARHMAPFMWSRGQTPSTKAIVRLVQEIGLDNLHYFGEVLYADRATTGKSSDADARLWSKKLIQEIHELYAKGMAERARRNVTEEVRARKELALSGEEVRRLLGDGPQVGQALRLLLKAVTSGDCLNRPEDLTGLLQQLVGRGELVVRSAP